LQRLASLNIRSREDVVRRYDHEVQGGSVVRPLVGVHHDAPSDAAVLIPLESHEARVAHPESAPADGPRGIALAIGLCPEAGLIDPYVMAWRAIDEAVRNAVAVGADPSQIAILDNFSWGDARLPDRCGALVLCAEGCRDAALSYGTPFVSGKDSLNNEWTAPDGTRRAIPPTLVVTALGLVPDATRSVTSDLKAAGTALYVLGATTDALCGPPDAEAPGRYVALHAAMRAGLVVACHDASEGGLGVALAEMAIGGRLGVTVDLTPAAPGVRTDRALFAEDPARLVVEVTSARAPAFEAAMAGHACQPIGLVTAEPVLALNGARVPLADAVAAFKSGSAE
jgi:phosphoribosylformylglycinamidine synthase